MTSSPQTGEREAFENHMKKFGWFSCIRTETGEYYDLEQQWQLWKAALDSVKHNRELNDFDSWWESTGNQSYNQREAAKEAWQAARASLAPREVERFSDIAEKYWLAENKLNDTILEMCKGFNWQTTTTDSYDASIEFKMADIGSELSDAAIDYLKSHGFLRAWVCFKDWSEDYYDFSTKKKHHKIAKDNSRNPEFKR